MYIRDDFYVDSCMEGEIEDGYLKLYIMNETIYGKIINEIYLSRESVEELIIQLIQEYPNITVIEKSSDLI